jgi:alkylation response protein AidB-like acyl-CoA dehydrogenase
VELEFTDEQLELRAAVHAMLERECPRSLVRAVIEKGASASGADGLWRQMVALGWPALTVPTSAGGLGLGWVELAVVLEELGQSVAPVPYLSTVTQFLPHVASSLSLAAAVAEGTTGALVTLDGSELGGTSGYVLGVPGAELLAVVAGGRVHVVRADAPGVSVTPVAALDASRPLGRVTFDGATAEEVLELDPTARHQAVVGVAIETVGACQAIFDLALEHARTRVQFGVPIGSFQAIKHKFADLLVVLEKARATSYFAAACLAESDDRAPLAASMAKAAAGDCQRLVAQEGIQVLGGMGFTWEHDMHLLVKRAKTGELLFGSTSWHRARVADLAGL